MPLGNDVQSQVNPATGHGGSWASRERPEGQEGSPTAGRTGRPAHRPTCPSHPTAFSGTGTPLPHRQLCTGAGCPQPGVEIGGIGHPWGRVLGPGWHLQAPRRSWEAGRQQGGRCVWLPLTYNLAVPRFPPLIQLFLAWWPQGLRMDMMRQTGLHFQAALSNHIWGRQGVGVWRGYRRLVSGGMASRTPSFQPWRLQRPEARLHSLTYPSSRGSWGPAVSCLPRFQPQTCGPELSGKKVRVILAPGPKGAQESSI